MLKLRTSSSNSFQDGFAKLGKNEIETFGSVFLFSVDWKKTLIWHEQNLFAFSVDFGRCATPIIFENASSLEECNS